MVLNKSTLSTQIYHILREDILTQAIPLGEKLTLKSLQERFQVSSTPIRDALTRLNEEGLVEYYSNVGVNVISLNRKDLIELFQFMGDLDSLSIRYASLHPEQSGILEKLEENILTTGCIKKQPLTSEEEISRWIACYDNFHLIFYDFCNNSRLTAAAKRLRSQLTIFSNAYERQSQPQSEILAEHEQIFQAYRQGDFTDAACLMKEHLNHSLDFALENLDGMI